jgi:hypothetical protein
MQELYDAIRAEITRLSNHVMSVIDNLNANSFSDALADKAGAIKLLCDEACDILARDDVKAFESAALNALLDIGCNKSDLPVINAICKAAKIIIEEVAPHTTEWNMTRLAHLVEPVHGRLLELGVSDEAANQFLDGAKAFIAKESDKMFGDLGSVGDFGRVNEEKPNSYEYPEADLSLDVVHSEKGGDAPLE